jgi:hypothetical protein
MHTVQLSDRSTVSIRWLQEGKYRGHCQLVFHGLCGHTVILPYAQEASVRLVQLLYDYLWRS